MDYHVSVSPSGYSYLLNGEYPVCVLAWGDDNCRWVGRFSGNRVLKVDLDLGYGSGSPTQNQSATEVHLWQYVIKPRDKRYFAPLYGHGSLDDGRAWVVQQYRVLVHGEFSPSAARIMNRLVTRYDLDDISVGWSGRNATIDLKTGLPIILDWGISC